MTARFLRAALLALALLAARSTPLMADVVHGEKGAAIDRYVTCLAAFGIAGALYVEKDGEVLVEKGYGLADRARGLTLTAEDPFYIGSLSKQFTAAAILALEADGRLSLADSLGRFFPDAPPATRGLTLDRLLSHTSGLPYFPRRPFFESRPRDSVMREMLELPLDFAPGERYSYSNCGYTLLAGVIERASGRRFEDYLRSRIFDRAGLTRTRCLDFALRDTADLGHVHAYSSDVDEGTMMHLRDFSKTVGAGTVVTTAADLGRWAAALAEERVLPALERDLLFTPHATVNAVTSYGYGWNVARTSRGTTMFFHAGDLGGWNAELRIDREARLVIAFLSNQRKDGEGSRAAIMTPVTLLAVGRALAELPQVRPARADERRALAGRFAFADGGALTARDTLGAIEVSAEDAAGFARLAAGAQPPDSLGFDRLAATIASDLARRSYATLSAALHPSLPGGLASAPLDTALADLDRRQGQWVRIEALGSVSTGPGTAVSFVRTHRERGASVLRLGWVAGKVLAFDLDAPSALPTRFLPAADGSWVNVDPFTARVTRLRPGRDAAGRVESLGVGEGADRAKRGM